MMVTGIRRWLTAVQSKTETPAQDCVFARAGRRRRARLITVLVGGAVICSSLAQAEVGVTISQMTPAREVRDGKPVEPGTVFKPDVGKVYVWFRVAGQKAPVQLRSQWHYLGGGDDLLIIESSEITALPQHVSADFRMELPPGRPWPVGDYRVDILSGDVVAGSAAFRVSAP
jgi:hypothetical protein